MIKKRIWLLTGEPATGKSTALSRILFEVKSAGFTVGGVLTREMRSHGEREGFRLVDISSEESEVLAQTKGVVGPRIGKYRVNLNALSTLATKALEHAKASSDLIACDEVGPMELLSAEFRNAVRSSIIQTKKPSICVVHKRFEDPIIEELRASEESIETEVTYENRDQLPIELAKDIIQLLSTNESRGS
ncbi:MAG: nucleoside-triphosphatase [Thaumarchaeota archaeon]|nr:nucleoside-triphosphatase [Nitrososphaerota archaeon]